MPILEKHLKLMRDKTLEEAAEVVLTYESEDWAGYAGIVTGEELSQAILSRKKNL